MRRLLFLLGWLYVFGCAPTSAPRGGITPPPPNAEIAAVQAQADKTLPYQEPMPPVHPGEWRNYWHEQSESPLQYVADHPSIIDRPRTTLYLQPLGEFSATQQSQHQILREFLTVYFNSPVVILPTLDLAALPRELVRRDGNRQTLRVIELTDKFLRPRLPADAWGIMALSAVDLFKSAGITGLYGDTLLYGRAGVISWFNLQGDLSLMLKGVTHESAHLLSLKHCQKFRCNLNGRITIEEFHQAPLYLCPDCMTKLAFAAHAKMKTRYQQLADLCQRYNLAREANFYRQAAGVVE